MALTQENQVIYVEPNMTVDDKNAYTTDAGYEKKAPDLEDFCIIVELDVDVKGRTYYYSNTASQDNVRMEAVDSAKGQVVHFMQGSKIYTNKEHTEYINSLTTNYTDCSLLDIKDGGTSEMFGIKSVDIQYDKFMVPQVTIQFVDVRGVSLFAQEEMRHNLVNNGIQGVVDNDIEGSFFKCFFTFPYPKFTLRIKGFYGQMATYELTCSDFRAGFDSETGNFNVTAKFIGYAFSFLNDVMTNALIAAPYSEYIGAKYWDDNAKPDGKFSVTDKNGSKVGMQRLGYICKEYRLIKEQAEKEIQENGLKNTMKANNIGTPEEQDLVDTADLTNIKNIYTQALNEFKAQNLNSNDGTDTIVTVEGSNSIAIFIDEDEDNIKAVQEKFYKDGGATGYHHQIQEDENFKKVQKLRDWFNSHSFSIGFYNSYNDIQSSSDESGFKIDANKISEPALRAAIEKKAREHVPGLDDNVTYKSQWLDGRRSSIYYYQDYGLKDILNSGTTLTSEQATEAKKVAEQATMQLELIKFENVFKFVPTLENITKIIMAHFETYTQMIGQCTKNILNATTKRTASNIGFALENLPDVKKNSSKDDGTIVPPFPLVTKQTTDKDGNEKTEDEWIGNYTNNSTFEEISLVEGLLAGIASAATDINSAVEGYDTKEEASAKCSVPNPICVGDLVLSNQSDNPFGKPNFDDANSIFGHIAIRGYSVIANLSNAATDTSMLGTYDAENFYQLFKGKVDFQKLKDALAGGVSADSLYTYFTSGKVTDSPNPSAKSNPWRTVSVLFSNMTNHTEYCVTRLGRIGKNDNGRLFALKNWSFNDFNSATGKENGKLTNSGLENLIGTPLSGEENFKSYNSTRFAYKKVKYMANSMGGDSSSLFDNCKFDIDSFKQTYLSDSEGGEAIGYSSVGGVVYSMPSQSRSYGTGDKYNQQTGADAITYDEFGAVSNADQLNKSFANVFCDKNYYETDGQGNTYKPHFFIQRAFTNTEKNVQSLIKILSSNDSKVIYMPKYLLLAVGDYCFQHPDKVNGLRPRTRQMLADEFISWANNGFKKIQTTYEFKFKNGYSFDSLIKSIGSEEDAEKIKAIVQKVCDSTWYNTFNDYCIIHGSDRISGGRVPAVYYKSSKVMGEALGDLLCVADICMCARCNNINDYPGFVVNSKGPIIQISQLKGYLSSIITGLKEKLGVRDAQDSNSSSITIDLDNDPDDIKIGVYKYIKMLYDKWIAADPECSNFKLENIFESSNPYFHFIDSCYNKIGKSYYINIGTLVEMLVKSQTANGYTMLSVMSDLYAANKMLFLIIQNFADLSKKEMLADMFTPISYVDHIEREPHSDFVVLSPGEPSSKLDVPDSGYNDDTFYLNDSTTWPIMITSKANAGYAIPAFGVSYGQQYQSYFKNIQVNMDSPMTTEQTIKAKFLICGASTGSENNGPREITMGQDLYTIYANNSYTCTVTMLGCAWVQPMMYFVLTNVPMFRGSYMIMKVQHQITPGNMITTFTGVRMSRNSTRAVKQFVYGLDNDSSNALTSQEQAEAAAANIGNDCNYGYYPPNGGGGTDFSGELSKKLINNLPSKAVDISNKFCKDWTLQQTLAAIAVQEFGGTSQTAIDQRIAVISCMYNWRGIKGANAYKTTIFQSGWRYFMIPSILSRLESASKRTTEWNMAQQEVYNVFKNGPYGYLEGKTNLLTNGKVTREQIQKGLHTPGTSDAQNMQHLIDVWGTVLYKLPPVNGYYHIITGDKGNPNGYVPKVEPKKDNRTKMSDLASGFTQAIQSSLNATESYASAKVTAKYGTPTSNSCMILLTAQGNNATNAMFDAIQDQYMDWWDKLYWCVGSANVNADAASVIVHMVSTKPSKHTMGVCGPYKITDGEKVTTLNITKKEELNNSLKLVMIKHFKDNNIKDANTAKARFVSIIQMNDDTISSLFELKGAQKSAVESCDTCLGGTSTEAANIPPVTKNGKTFNAGKASTWIENNSHDHYIKGVCGKCAKWVRLAIEAGGIGTAGRPVPARDYTGFLPTIGFGHIATLNTLQEQATWTQSNAKVGDIAVMRYQPNGHICMYTHKGRWVSDFKQQQMAASKKNMVCYIFRFA